MSVERELPCLPETIRQISMSSEIFINLFTGNYKFYHE